MHDKPSEMMVARNGAETKMLGQMDAEEEVEEVSTQLIYEDCEHACHSMQALHMMQKNRHFCDVILNVGNTEIHAHRAVLASVSPYLFELFSADDETKGNVRENTVIYKLNCSFQRAALDVLVDYAYTAKLCVDNRMVKKVYLAALHLRMDRVIKECARHLIKHLAVDNCIDTRVLSGISKHESFVSQVDTFIADKFEAVRLTPSFLSLVCVRVEILTQTRQEISMVEMNSVCQLVLDWIHRQVKEEGSGLSDMAEKSHMLYLALDNSLQDCSELPNGEMSDSEVVQDYKKLHKKTTTGKSRRKGQMQPAKPRVLLLTRDIGETPEVEKDGEWTLIAASKIADHTFQALVTVDSILATLSVAMRLSQPPTTPSPVATTPVSSSRAESQEKEVQPDTYCAMAHMSSVKCAIGCANLNEQLLVCGGYDRVECLKIVETYDPEWNLWAAVAPMREARGRFNIAVVRGEVYAVGGSNGTTELATVEKYNQDKQEWTRVANLPLARSHTGVCNLDDKIYCIGGWNGQVGIKQCDVLDPKIGEWTQIAPLQAGRQQAGVCAMNGLVFAVGGCDTWNCLNSVEVYDPSLNEWSFISEMITARRGCGVAAFRGKLYVVGGSDGSHTLSSTEIYDPETKSWTPGPNMTTPRANVGVAVIGSRLYAVGGFSGKSFLNTIEYLDENADEWTTFVPKTSSSTSSSPRSCSPFSSAVVSAAKMKQFDFAAAPAPAPEPEVTNGSNGDSEVASGEDNGYSRDDSSDMSVNGVLNGDKRDVGLKDNAVQDIMKENGVVDGTGVN